MKTDSFKILSIEDCRKNLFNLLSPRIIFFDIRTWLATRKTKLEFIPKTTLKDIIGKRIHAFNTRNTLYVRVYYACVNREYVLSVDRKCMKSRLLQRIQQELGMRVMMEHSLKQKATVL